MSRAGPAIDRFGRKGAMVLSLGVGCLFMLALGRVATLPGAVALLVFKGMTDPLYRVGSDAMVADLIPPEKRADAYALLRMSANLGVAIGPSIGGFITAVSYGLAFSIAAASALTYALLVAVFMRETIPQWPADDRARQVRGYGPVLRDRPFLTIYLRQRLDVPVTSIALLLTANSLAGLASTSIAGPAVDRFGGELSRPEKVYLVAPKQRKSGLTLRPRSLQSSHSMGRSVSRSGTGWRGTRNILSAHACGMGG